MQLFSPTLEVVTGERHTLERPVFGIRHEPDNRFLECALAARADFIVTVNTASGHFDRKQYQTPAVLRPGEFLNLSAVGRLVEKLIRG
jgi:predicted nucleic acid-binding protein